MMIGITNNANDDDVHNAYIVKNNCQDPDRFDYNLRQHYSLSSRHGIDKQHED